VKSCLRKEGTKRDRDHLKKGVGCPATGAEDIGDVIKERGRQKCAPGRARMIDGELRVGVAKEM
jgi:hypothetical protein